MIKNLLINAIVVLLITLRATTAITQTYIRPDIDQDKAKKLKIRTLEVRYTGDSQNSDIKDSLIHRFEYDTRGNLTKEIMSYVFDLSSGSVYNIFYEYDKKGNKTKSLVEKKIITESYYYKGKPGDIIRSRKEYLYDKKSRLIKELHYTAYDSISPEFEGLYEYDKKGNLIKYNSKDLRDSRSGLNYTTTYTYNLKKQLSKKETIYDNKKEKGEEKYYYDNEGRLIEYKRNMGDMNDHKEVFNYDDKGNIAVSEKSFYRIGDMIQREKVTNEYDENNRLVSSSTVKKDGYIISCEYSYYDNGLIKEVIFYEDEGIKAYSLKYLYEYY